MKILDLGCGVDPDRWIIPEADRIDGNLDPSYGTSVWLGIGELAESDKYDIVFMSYSLRYNTHCMKDFVKALEKITKSGTLLEVIDYCEYEDYDNNKCNDIAPERYIEVFIKPLEEIGFEIHDQIDGRVSSIFLRLVRK